MILSLQTAKFFALLYLFIVFVSLLMNEEYCRFFISYGWSVFLIGPAIDVLKTSDDEWKEAFEEENSHD